MWDLLFRKLDDVEPQSSSGARLFKTAVVPR